jgi:hypothetical protein
MNATSNNTSTNPGSVPSGIKRKMRGPTVTVDDIPNIDENSTI